MNTAEAARVIARIRDLPTLPRTVLRITELINNPGTSARDLAGVITDDQVLTARLLRLVNSSFYGFPQPISTVTAAVVLLGFDAIRHLLLTTSIFELFANGKKEKRSRQEALWDHSLACAVAAKVIGDRIGHGRVEELFVAGLLHDIGKIVEMLYMGGRYDEVSRRVQQDRCLFIEAEEAVMGVSHPMIGSLLADRWNLPAKLAAVIGHHHEPARADTFAREAAVVHLADILARAMGFGSGWDMQMPALDAAAWDLLALERTAVEPIMTETADGFDDIRNSMSE